MRPALIVMGIVAIAYIWLIAKGILTVQQYQIDTQIEELLKVSVCRHEGTRRIKCSTQLKIGS